MKESARTSNPENYYKVNKDGDTLEISEKKLELEKNSNKIIVSEHDASKETKMSDAALAKCSKGKLKQLLLDGTISRQQYNKAMKKHE